MRDNLSFSLSNLSGQPARDGSGEGRHPVAAHAQIEPELLDFRLDSSGGSAAQLIQTCSVLLLLPFSTVLGFTLYEDTGNGRAATHQL